MSTNFTGRLSPSDGPHQFGPKSIYSKYVLRVSRLRGVVKYAVFQLVISLLLPSKYAIIPCAMVILCFTANIIIHATTPCAGVNPFMENVVLGRTTSQVPFSDGTFGSEPAAQGLVVFNLGIQYNHPLGPLCPLGMEIAQRFQKMNKDMLRRPEELGLLSVNYWKGATADSENMAVITYYFRNVESIHRFAHEPLHRGTWDWYKSHNPTHIGIYHETFVVPEKSHESIYENCSPIGLGRGSVKSVDGKSGNSWVNTVVSADMPALKSQTARLAGSLRKTP
ncbi:hypothetical protein MAJ_09992, partial [Metarhizium majus ARSEF 297]